MCKKYSKLGFFNMVKKCLATIFCFLLWFGFWCQCFSGIDDDCLSAFVGLALYQILLSLEMIIRTIRFYYQTLESSSIHCNVP